MSSPLEIVFSSEFVSKALNTTPTGASVEGFQRIWTDSRSVEEGDLFVPLRGENFDGHEFVADALSKGARGALLDEKAASTLELDQGAAQIFTVPDTLVAFQNLAQAWRNEFSIPFVAIAGSNGKTTTKELIASILTGKFNPVLKTIGSQNGDVGIPMTLLSLRENHRAAVIEIGIDRIGAMEEHLNLVKPDAAIVTSIGNEHMEFFKSLATVAKEETTALHWVAKKGGLIAINFSDPWIMGEIKSTLLEKTEEFMSVGYALVESGREDQVAFPVPSAIGAYVSGASSIQLSGEIFSKQEFDLPLKGHHNASNLLGALAIAHGLRVSPEEAREGLCRFESPKGRAEERSLPNGARILCDYYNSNPDSLEASIRLFSEWNAERKFVVLGDMLELGKSEEKLHRQFSENLSELQCEGILLFGKRMQWLEHQLRKEKYKGYLLHAEDKAQISSYLENNLNKGDAVLIKGSRGMALETILEDLTHEN